MRTNILFLVLATLGFGWPDSVSAQFHQAWVARYTNGTAVAMKLDGAGNAILTGSLIGTNGNFDFLTVKYAGTGTQLWAAHFNGPANGDDSAAGLALDTAGNVYVTGYATSTNGESVFATVKHDSNGNQLWARFYQPLYQFRGGSAIALDDSGQVCIAISSSRRCLFGGICLATELVKYDENGNQMWERHFSFGRIAGLAINPSRHIFIAGSVLAGPFDGPHLDFVLAKIDANGTEIWSATYGGASDDRASALAVDSAGNAHVAGLSHHCGRSGLDVVTAEFDGNGHRLWVSRRETWDFKDDRHPILAVDSNGNAVVSSGSLPLLGPSIWKLDSGGTERWHARVNGVPTRDAFDLSSAQALDEAGSVFFTCPSESGGTLIMKYDSNGSQRWAAQADIGVPSAIAIDAAGNVYVTGNSDFATVKYVPADASGSPVITIPPQSRIVPAGSDVTFTVSANGTEPLEYAWFLNGDLLPANGSTLSVTDVECAQVGEYSVRVRNASGESFSPVARLSGIVEFRAPVLSSNRVLEFTIVGPSGCWYEVQASYGFDNFDCWWSLGRVLNETGTVQFTDTPESFSSQRFYRVVALP